MIITVTAPPMAPWSMAQSNFFLLRSSLFGSFMALHYAKTNNYPPDYIDSLIKFTSPTFDNKLDNLHIIDGCVRIKLAYGSEHDNKH